MFRIPTALILAVLAGCDPTDEANGPSTPGAAVDTDADGLNDDEEASLGTDPANADSDGDTLNDKAEVDGGTDPLNVDTDGDSYQDNWELTEGTDPMDAKSVIYQGGWPYNPDKSAYDGRSWDDAGVNEGDPIPAFTYVDIYGDEVNIADFADQGKPIIIDVSAMWCPPCQGLAKWLAGISDPYHWEDAAPLVHAAVENGDVYWVTILGDDLNGTYDVNVDELNEWYNAYPDANIPVMADDPDEHYAVAHILQDGWPTLILMDDTLTVETGAYGSSDASWYSAIYMLEDQLEAAQ